MPGPIHGLKFIHNSFRNGLQRSKAEIQFWATLADGDPQAIHDRFAMLHQSLALHEMAEEEVLFPAADAKKAGTADVYVQAHRQIDPLRDSILEACAAQNADKAFDGIMELVPLMNAHLDQEEGELWPFCEAEMSVEEQIGLMGGMAQKIPPEKFGGLVPWMVQLLSADDREAVMRMWQGALPEPVYENVKGWVKGALRDNEWADLTGRIPELA